MSQRNKPQNPTRQKYIVFFYDGWHIPEPDYIWVAEVDGKNPQDALETSLQQIIQTVREMLQLDEDDLSDYKIQEALYIVPSDYWMSYNEVYWHASLSAAAE